MKIIVVILLISVLIVFIEAPVLRKKSLKKERRVFFMLLLSGTGLCIAEALEVNIPNPLDWIAFVYKPLSDLIFAAVE